MRHERSLEEPHKQGGGIQYTLENLCGLMLKRGHLSFVSYNKIEEACFTIGFASTAKTFFSSFSPQQPLTQGG